MERKFTLCTIEEAFDLPKQGFVTVGPAYRTVTPYQPEGGEWKKKLGICVHKGCNKQADHEGAHS